MQIVRLFGAFVAAALSIVASEMLDAESIVENYDDFATVLKVGMYGIAVTATLSAALEIMAIMTVSENRKAKPVSNPLPSRPYLVGRIRRKSSSSGSGWPGYDSAGNPYTSRRPRRSKRSDLMPPKNW